MNHMGLQERSAGEVLQDVTQDIGNLVRAELRLARAELGEKAKKAGKAGGLLGAAAVTGLFSGACAVTTCIAALALAMPLWLAALIMSIFLVCIAAACYFGGKKRMKQIDPVPERTVQTIREDVQWAKDRIK